MGAIVTQSDVAEFQAMAEAEMDDQCQIRRRTGETNPVSDPAKVTPTYTTIYSGPCRVKLTSRIGINPAAADRRIVGDQRVTINRVLLQVPISAVGVETDDIVDFTSTQDPDLEAMAAAGKFHRIDGPFRGQTHGVCRRFWLEEPT